jgi:hypothetical protein
MSKFLYQTQPGRWQPHHTWMELSLMGEIRTLVLNLSLIPLPFSLIKNLRFKKVQEVYDISLKMKKNGRWMWK